jgi:large subunit ribosomal protein L24
MSGLKIRKNDTVVVISGKDKGKRGRVIEVLPKLSRVRVEGVSKIKRHTKPNPQKNVKGGIVERESPVHVSNVALIDPKSDKPTRVGMKAMPDGTRARVARRSGLQLDK